jgi:hypothetical protein
MARQDLVGLLTGVQSTQQPISATNPQDWRMQFGQRQSEKMNQRLRGLTGRMSTQEALGAGLSQLDLSTPKGLRTLAKLQQSTGDLTGAARTAAAVRELEVEGKTRTAVAEQLANLGQTTEAQQVLDKTLSTAAGQSLVTQIKGEQRRGAASAAQAAAKSKRETLQKRNAASQLLILKGFPQDSEEVQQIQDGVFDGFSDSQLTSALNSLALYSNPKITSDALTAYNVEGQGVKMVGKWSIETPQGVKQVFGYRDENGIPTPIDPETSTKVKELEGISSSNTRVKNIMIQLATAGGLGAVDEKGKPIAGFLTDADDAWNGLPPEKQLEVATAIDVRAEFYRKRKGMNQLQAQRKAIKEIFTDNVEEKGFTADFNFDDTVLNLGKFETEIAKEFIDPSSSNQSGTFKGTTNSGIDIEFSVKPQG